MLTQFPSFYHHVNPLPLWKKLIMQNAYTRQWQFCEQKKSSAENATIETFTLPFESMVTTKVDNFSLFCIHGICRIFRSHLIAQIDCNLASVLCNSICQQNLFLELIKIIMNFFNKKPRGVIFRRCRRWLLKHEEEIPFQGSLFANNFIS